MHADDVHGGNTVHVTMVMIINSIHHWLVIALSLVIIQIIQMRAPNCTLSVWLGLLFT